MEEEMIETSDAQQDDVTPHHYDIQLKFDVVDSIFNGSVCIDVTIFKTTNKIFLDAEGLSINNVYLIIDNVTFETKEIVVDESKLQAILIFSENLISGSEAQLYIDFDGYFEGEAHLYNSVPIRENQDPTTYFYSFGSGQCFPCWDDSQYTASYHLSVVIPKELIALSNMPADSIRTFKDLKTVVFETTPKMKINSLVIVLGDFTYVESTLDETTIRIYTPKNEEHRGNFALQTATEIVAYYNTYFQYKYPLTKLDCIELSVLSANHDNIGLLIFTDHCLYTETEKPVNNIEKQSLRLNISRKIVGQWIGTIITPEYEDELWFINSLATFLQNMTVTELYYTDGSVLDEFICRRLSKTLEIDSLKSSHPITGSEESTGICNEVTYLKMPSLIYMLQTLMNKEKFREGLVAFIREFANTPISSYHLWDIMEKVSGHPVGDIMLTWLNQPGFPVLNISCKQEGRNRIVSITQQRFMADGSSNDCLWIIPLGIITAKDPHEIRYRVIMPAKKSMEITLEDIEEDNWITVNIGYYRILYSEEIINTIGPNIKNRFVHELHRYAIITDTFQCAKAGYVSTKEFFKLLIFYQHETSYAVWYSIMNSLCIISSLVSHLPMYEDLRIACLKLYSNICEHTGWEEETNENSLVTLLRPLIITHMSNLLDPFTIKEAEKRFILYLAGDSYPGYLRSAIYIGVMNTGNDNYLEPLLNLYFKTNSHEEKSRIFVALGAAKEECLLHTVLELSVGNEINPKYGKLVYKLIPLLSKNRKIAWNFVKENWRKFARKYCGTYMSDLKKCVSQYFVTENEAVDVSKFYENHKSFVDDPVDYFVDSIKINAKWLLRDKAVIERSICEFLE